MAGTHVAEGNMIRINCPHCTYYTYKHLRDHSGMQMLQEHIAKEHYGLCEPAPTEPTATAPAT